MDFKRNLLFLDNAPISFKNPWSYEIYSFNYFCLILLLLSSFTVVIFFFCCSLFCLGSVRSPIQAN